MKIIARRGKWQRYAIAGTVIFFSYYALASDVAAHWQILKDKSTIEWTATYGGKPVTGTFPAFTTDIAFDGDHVEASRAVITIETTKIKSDDHDAQENLPTVEWFASTQYPLATFESKGFKHIKDDQYELEGTLTVRNKTAPVTLPFTAKFYDDKDAVPPAHYARIEGETTVKRTALGVGQGDWAQTDTIADDVKVAIHLEAKQVP